MLGTLMSMKRCPVMEKPSTGSPIPRKMFSTGIKSLQRGRTDPYPSLKMSEKTKTGRIEAAAKIFPRIEALESSSLCLLCTFPKQAKELTAERTLADVP